MSKKIKVAFDLGNSSLKIAAWKKGGLELHELPMPENLIEEDNILMPHAFSAFLKKAKKDLHLPGGPAGLLLPSGKAICRLVTMPRMTVDQLMLNLPYEFNDFIHGEPHQYYCDYAVCEDEPQEPGLQEEQDEEQLTMMAAVVQRQQIQDHIRIFSAGGLLPQAHPASGNVFDSFGAELLPGETGGITGVLLHRLGLFVNPHFCRPRRPYSGCPPGTYRLSGSGWGGG